MFSEGLSGDTETTVYHYDRGYMLSHIKTRGEANSRFRFMELTFTKDGQSDIVYSFGDSSCTHYDVDTGDVYFTKPIEKVGACFDNSKIVQMYFCEIGSSTTIVAGREMGSCLTSNAPSC